MAKFSVLISPYETLRQWVSALRNLSFRDNFTGYEWTGEILPGEEKAITHGLKVIPTRFILTDAQGTNLIIRGDTKPTATHFFVTNVASSSTFKGKILVMP